VVNKEPTQLGYFNSAFPQKGALGNAQVSRYGVANYGQANIVRSYEAKKPICLFAAGKDGSAVIYHNVYCGLTDVNHVTVQTRKGKKSFQVTGNTLHVMLMD
jgi:hypothetical protein